MGSDKRSDESAVATPASQARSEKAPEQARDAGAGFGDVHGTTSLDGATISSEAGVDPGRSPASGLRGGYVPTFVPGELLAGRYRVVRFIARGGMGEVYEAEDQELGGRVALKTVRGEQVEGEKTIQRFKREIQLARKVSHPNVCRTFDLGRHRLPPAKPGEPETDLLFLTMELLEGETLTQRVKKLGRLAPQAAFPIVKQMAAALECAHEAGIVHRDFKCSNVLLVPGKVGERVVVTDFGLARGETDATVTGADDVLGTPAYMAPEQVRGGRAGPPADLYALGVVMYEMVTGSLPFPGESPLSIAVRRLKENPAPPRRLVPSLDARWEAAILRCMEREPEDRFESASDVVRVLEGETVPVGRKKRRLAFAAGAAAVVVAAAIGFWLARSRPAPAPTPAAPAAAEAPASATKPRRSVAVLGFKNLGQPQANWMSTAIAEMLRTELAAGGGVRTVAGENVARMKLELSLAETDSLAPDTLSRIRTLIAADYVVLGSYLALGKDKLRIDLRLQDAGGGELLTSSAAEGSESELFQLVSEAGLKLRAALGLGEVSAMDASEARASFPTDPAAARLYSEGLAKLRVFDALEARARLERAAAAEPRHPLIHAALASAWQALGYDAKARGESLQAFELAKELPREERLAVQGLHYETTDDWDKAVETYKALLVFFPDRLDYGLRLAAALTAAGQGKQALEVARELERLPAPDSADPRIDLAKAAAAKAMTDFPLQLEAARAAAEKATRQGARLLLAQARLAEGTALVNSGKLQEARRACEESGEIFAAAGDGGNVARSENIIAVSHARAGDMANAKRRFEKSLSAFRRIGDQRGIAAQLTNVALATLFLGNAAEARRLNSEALAISREIGDKSGVARALNNLAKTLDEMNDLPGARRRFEEAIAAYREIGESRNAALATSNLGEVLQRQKDLAGARRQFEASLELSRAAGARADSAVTLTLLAKLLVEQGDLDGAGRAQQDALALFRAENDRRGEAGVLRAQADLADERGAKDAAKRLRAQAERLDAETKAAR